MPHDTSAHDRRAQSHEILAAANAVLGRSLDLRETADAIARAAIPRFADWAVLDAFDAEGRLTRLALAHEDPARRAAAEALDRRWPPNFERRAATRSVLTAAEPLLLPEVRDEHFAPLAHDAEHFAAWKAFGVRSCIAVPLDAAGERLGVLSFFLTEDGRRYDAADLPLAIELGQRAATALLHAQLYARERRAHAETLAARDRTERLQRLSAELTRSLTPDAVIDVVVRHLVVALDARASGVYELSPDGREYRMLGSAGLTAPQRERLARVPVETPLPIGEVARTRTAVLVEDCAAWRASHPAMPVIPGDGLIAIAALPLHVEDRLLGALTVTLPGPRTFAEEERGFLQAFADLCAQALDRARLFEAEATARVLAERLQALTIALGDARTHDEVAQIVGREACAAVGANVAGVALLADDGRAFSMRSHVGVDDVARAEWDSFPNTTDLPYGVVVVDRAPLFFQTRATYVDRFPNLAEALAAVDVEASIILPLVTGDGRVLGAMHFNFLRPRMFAAAERHVFTSIAQQSAAAFERVRLYEAEAARGEAETARAVAEAASRAKDELLAVVSHELRAPLAPARALAQVLARDESLDADRRALAAEIERHIAFEARLIDDLVEYEGAARGQLTVECRAIDVSEAVRVALRGVRPTLQAMRMPVTEAFVAADSVAWADGIRVQQVVHNLLRNAAGNSRYGAPVVIRTSNPAPEWIEIAIEDSGFGIAGDDLPRLFQPFTRLGSNRGRHRGMGLGLALSRRLAELQGGALTATSDGVGHGATFTLRLPTARLRAAAAVPPPPTAATSAPETRDAVGDRGLRILLVEDEGSTARALRRLLALDGHVVHVAENLAAAERLACAGPIDVLLSDLQLAGESGLDAPRRVAVAARRCGHRAPPAVVLSGFARDSDMAQTRAAGFVAHLAKPVDDELLLRTLHEVARV